MSKFRAATSHLLVLVSCSFTYLAPSCQTQTMISMICYSAHSDNHPKRLSPPEAMQKNCKLSVLSCSDSPSSESDEDVVSDASESGFVNLYPLEGKYKDKADRAR